MKWIFITLLVTLGIALSAGKVMESEVECYEPHYPCKILDLPGEADDLWLISPGGETLKWGGGET